MRSATRRSASFARTRTPRSTRANSCCRRRCSPRPSHCDGPGLSLRDIDLVEMHEAFAAQVLSNLRGFESKAWAERAGFSEPVGEVDRARLNVMGGSIAIGHPFGATGARITTTLLNELGRRGGQFGLMTVCAAGGMGFAMVVERQ